MPPPPPHTHLTKIPPPVPRMGLGPSEAAVPTPIRMGRPPPSITLHPPSVCAGAWGWGAAPWSCGVGGGLRGPRTEGSGCSPARRHSSFSLNAPSVSSSAPSLILLLNPRVGGGGVLHSLSGGPGGGEGGLRGGWLFYRPSYGVTLFDVECY